MTENMETDEENVEEDIDGCIHSIHVRNFFCHENLEVTLNRNVNFIVGRNGSGKSAVLTALVVGLGGRASATNRGSSLSSFIKKGQNSATIEIKIKNNSSKAFKPNIYGDYITIVRTINASGGSSYKVKSTTGEVISTKYEEVNGIILAHDIQVDNPISVLNQDDARSFHASDSKKKYALFRKATNLDQTEGNYVRALENCNKAVAIWTRKKDACVELEKEYKKWKTSHEQLQSRDEMEAQKQALQNEYYWSEIADFEKEANTIQAQHDKQKAKMEKLAEKLKKMEQNYGSNNEAIQALKNQLNEKTQERSALEQELRKLESEVREVQSTQRSTQNSSGKQRELMSREQRKVADLEREIRNIESGSAADQRAALEAAAEAARAASAAAEARYHTAQHHAQQARANLAHAQAQAEQMTSRAQRQRDSISKRSLYPMYRYAAAEARYHTAQHHAQQARANLAHAQAQAEQMTSRAQRQRDSISKRSLYPMYRYAAAEARYHTAQHHAQQARANLAHAQAQAEQMTSRAQRQRDSISKRSLYPMYRYAAAEARYHTAQHHAQQARANLAHAQAQAEQMTSRAQRQRDSISKRSLYPMYRYAAAEARYHTAQHHAQQARANLAHAQAQAEQMTSRAQRQRDSISKRSLYPMYRYAAAEARYHTAQHHAQQARANLAHAQAQAEQMTSRAQRQRDSISKRSLYPMYRYAAAEARYHTAQHHAQQARANLAHAQAQAEQMTSRAQRQRDSISKRSLYPMYRYAAAEARYHTAQHHAQQARANLAHAQAQAEQMTSRAQRQRDSIKQLKQQLRELESRGNDSLAVYGNNMVELCQRLKRSVAKGEFTAPPRGPVGSYLKVKEKRWGGALEHIIGGSMRAFCVNTPEDSRKLFEIMGQVYGKASKPSVTCSKFLSKAHDVNRNKVRASGFLSALDSVDVSDSVVANFLIDQVSLESILLVPDHEDAVRLSDNEENVPENCSKIVTLDSSEYYPAPNYRSYGGANKQSQLLQVSTAERKRQVQAEIAEAEAVLRALEAKAEELSAEASEARDAERAAARSLQALLALRHEKSEAADQAAAALQQENTPHHAVLEDELNISKEKLRTLQEQVEAASSKDREFRRQIDAIEANMKTAKNQLREATAAARTLSEEIDQEQNKLDQGVTESRTWEQRIREDKIKLTQVEAILEEKREVIKRKEREALTLCTRIENPRDKAVVTNELTKTQLKLSSIRSDGLTKAQVAEKLLEVERKYRRTKLTLDRLKLLIDDIKNTTDKHLNFCHRVQTYIARRVQYCFQSILTLRGFSGRMDIDNARGMLEIRCTGRESSSKRHASSTSSLSGGERSYSTVAFIMALWECVELPFYFMDEFDVFMDNVNRKIVMELLIDHALKNTSRQFVFLTPQDASSVQAGPQISIHLMADPRP